MWRWLRIAPLLLLSAPALGQDTDGDGALDAVDAHPCDARAVGTLFAPGAGAFGTRLFEDQWPAAGDLDFNDVVVAYNYALHVDGAGATTTLVATFDVLALGGDFDNGLGLRLPVDRAQLTSARRTVGATTVDLAPSLADAQVVLRVDDDLRAGFGLPGRINADPDQPRVMPRRIVVEVVFATPVALSAAEAPFDLFVYRTADPSLEVHAPSAGGTAAFDSTRFGTGDDRSSADRRFVDTQGLPFVLDLPVDAPYPGEGVGLATLFPRVLDFAASGGTSALDFYTQPVATAAYADATGQGPAAPGPLSVVVDDACMTCTDGIRNRDEAQVDCGGTHCAPCPEQRFTTPNTSLTFTVPAGVTELEVHMWGAGGGGSHGGAGGYTTGFVAVTPGEVLGVEVGGADYGPHPSAYSTYPAGGGRSALTRGGRTGELLVAGGGGAGSSYAGGAGGGTSGQGGLGGPSTRGGYGQRSYNTGGGTQTAGGARGCSTYWGGHNQCGVNGGRIHGSRGHNNRLHQGGFGGGGYYGGGSGGASAYTGAGGGGGSGFVAASGVRAGQTVGGDRATPGQASHPDRGAAGAPGQPGFVIIRF